MSSVFRKRLWTAERYRRVGGIDGKGMSRESYGDGKGACTGVDSRTNRPAKSRTGTNLLFKVGGFGGRLGYGIPFFSHLPLAICDCFRLLRVNQLLDRLYLKISTNLLRQQVVDFPMSRNRRTPITSTIAPPGMTTAFTDHYTSSTSKVFQQFNSFHAMTTFSSW